MKYNFLYPINIILISILAATGFYSCKKPSIDFINKRALIINATNSNSYDLFKADSLFLDLKLSEALTQYENALLDSVITSSQRLYIIKRLKEIEYEFGLSTSVSNEYPRVVKEPISVRLALYEDFRQVNLQDLKKRLRDTGFKSDSIEIAQNISLYYDLVEYQYDSSKVYTALSEQLLSEFPGLTILHIRQALQTINLLSYNRKNIEAMEIANRMISELIEQKISNSLFHEIILEQRAYLSLRLEQYKECQIDIHNIYKTAGTNKCSKNYHRALKLQLYLSIYTDDSSQYNKSILEYDNLAAHCEKRFINIHQIKGRYYTIKGMMDKALVHLEKAKNWYHKYDADNINIRKNINYMLSEAYLHDHQFDNSINSYIQNLSVGTRNYNIKDLIDSQPLHEYFYIDLLRIGSIILKKWHTDRKSETLQNAYKVLMKSHEESKNVLNTFNENKIQRFIDYENELYSHLAYISHELYSQTNDESDFEQAWKYASLKNNLIFQKDILVQYADQNVPKYLKDQIVEIQKLIKEETNNGLIDNTNLKDIYEKRNVLDSLANSYSLERNIKDELTDNNSLSSIQKDINNSESILSISTDDEYVYTYHITNESFKGYRRGHDSSIESLVEEYSEFINSLNQSVSNYKKIANELFELTIGKELLEETNQNLIIILDNILSPLSIESLTIDTSGTNYSNLSYLTLKKNVTYSMNSKIQNISINSHQKLADKKILAFSFSDKKTFTEHQTRLPELRGTHDEIELLRSIFNRGSFYTGCNATKNNLLIELDNPYDIIHIATHGSVNNQARDDMKLFFRNSRCGLDSLFGFQFLTKYFNGAEVVLNACESNKNSSKSRAESYNFTRYLLKSGAKKVITSQWNLNDQVSSQLIGKYYQEEDLSNAKKSILTEPESSHPYYWGALKEFRS